MAVTETETISWGSRLGDSLRGIVGGVVIFVASFPLLFWNEGRAVKTAKALDEGAGRVVSVESNAKVDSEYEGKLVHMTGRADTKDVLKDPVFGVTENCIRLKRDVEIYQWVENTETKTKKNLGGSETKTTVYTYELAWVRNAVNSSGFKEKGHDNPPIGLEFPSDKWQAESVSFGAFKLSADQISGIGDERDYVFPAGFTCRVDRVQIDGNVIYVPEKVTRDNPLNRRDVRSQTRPGDMRVTYQVVRPHDISIVSKQHGAGFVPYKAKNGYKVDMLHDGVSTAEEMFDSARTGNSLFTWILRIVGFLLMASGLKTVFRPISTLGDVLPLLGDLLEAGIGLIANVVAFVLSLTTIAIAWLFYRPVIGIVLLLIAGAGVFFLLKKRTAAKVKKESPDGAAVNPQ